MFLLDKKKIKTSEYYTDGSTVLSRLSLEIFLDKPESECYLTKVAQQIYIKKEVKRYITSTSNGNSKRMMKYEVRKKEEESK